MSLTDTISSLFQLPNSARKPRGSVSINGIIIPFDSFEIDNNSYYIADTFRVEIPVKSLPLNLAPIVIISQPAIIVEISAGFPLLPDILSTAGLDNLITGQVDDVDYEPASGKITLSGRDLTALFIDSKTTEKFVNLTSSQIATLFAKRRNLTPVVTDTTIKVGKYYEIDHARLTSQRTEWDLLTFLAQEENFNVFVKGKSLYFQPKPSGDSIPYVINYVPGFLGGSDNSNMVSIVFSRNFTLSKDIIVEVRSWNQKQRKGFTKRATATHTKNSVLSGAAQPIGEAQVFPYIFPNLTPEQALQKAQNLLKQLSSHEVKLRAEGPADNLININSSIQVLGTGTLFDQIYFPSSIIRRMSVNDGYSMTISAKNHSPETEILV
jgi:phage protein D